VVKKDQEKLGTVPKCFLAYLSPKGGSLFSDRSEHPLCGVFRKEDGATTIGLILPGQQGYSYTNWITKAREYFLTLFTKGKIAEKPEIHMKNYCAICGKPSGFFPLCPEHAKMRKNGEIVKNKEGRWVVISKVDDPKVSSRCIICGEESHGRPFCHECWNAMHDVENSMKIPGRTSLFEYYYYNIQSQLRNHKNYKGNRENLYKMVVLASDLFDGFGDSTLLSKLQNDISSFTGFVYHGTYFTDYLSIGEDNPVEDEEDEDGQECTAEDGHVCDSAEEAAVDNLLYQHGWIHAIGQQVININERGVFCDFFLPGNRDRGIYIEFWGLKTRKYMENKEEKTKLYRKHHLPLIEIVPDELKHTDVLVARLGREIRRLNKEQNLGILIPGGE
jgi:hypothetical protein